MMCNICGNHNELERKEWLEEYLSSIRRAIFRQDEPSKTFYKKRSSKRNLTKSDSIKKW